MDFCLWDAIGRREANLGPVQLRPACAQAAPLAGHSFGWTPPSVASDYGFPEDVLQAGLYGKQQHKSKAMYETLCQMATLTLV